MVVKFNVGEFAWEGGQIKMVMEVSRGPVDRFRLQAIDGTSYENIPGYCMKIASQEEVKAALAAAKMDPP